MKKIFLIFAMLLIKPVSAELEVHFTPSSECEDSIVHLIKTSQKTIDVAIYSINNDQIVSALKEAHNRGVYLRILTDRMQAASKSSKVLDLYQFGINIKVNSKFRIEHNKFAVFDAAKVSTGSFNWTNPASKKNSENCLFVTENPKVIVMYENRFNELWKLNSDIKSDNWFERKLHQ
ncbi:MAG: phospholipase D family protein [Alphaproteobacteria bacterium]|nr:phospholipase D family protein [Alphaproteobacteria bacterium]